MPVAQKLLAYSRVEVRGRQAVAYRLRKLVHNSIRVRCTISGAHGVHFMASTSPVVQLLTRVVI